MLRTILPVFVFLVVAQSGYAQSAFLPKNLGGGINTMEYDEVSPVDFVRPQDTVLRAVE